MAKKMLLFNLTGHPLPTTPKNREVIDIAVPNFQLDTPTAVLDSAKTLLAGIYRDFHEALLKGDYEIAFPGMNIIALTTMTILHGISGHFPKTRWIYRTENGFALSKTLDLQKIRIDSRDARFFGKLP